MKKSSEALWLYQNYANDYLRARTLVERIVQKHGADEFSLQELRVHIRSGLYEAIGSTLRQPRFVLLHSFAYEGDGQGVVAVATTLYGAPEQTAIPFLGGDRAFLSPVREQGEELVQYRYCFGMSETELSLLIAHACIHELAAAPNQIEFQRLLSSIRAETRPAAIELEHSVVVDRLHPQSANAA